MKSIYFNYNWNNKLDCKAFTTMRLSGNYNVGDLVEIKLKNKMHSFGKIVDAKCFKLKDINNFIAYLDTGYDKIECKKILEKMYKNKNIDWITQNIYFYLICKNRD